MGRGWIQEYVVVVSIHRARVVMAPHTARSSALLSASTSISVAVSVVAVSSPLAAPRYPSLPLAAPSSTYGFRLIKMSAVKV